jgi:hypothetical protein
MIPCLIAANAWSRLRFLLRKFLTDWTNVSTAMEAVKGILFEMIGRKRPPARQEKLVQFIGPQLGARESFRRRGQFTFFRRQAAPLQKLPRAEKSKLSPSILRAGA